MAQKTPQRRDTLKLTDHGRRRMAQRGVRPHQLTAVLSWGRRAMVRGVEIYVVGHREVRSASEQGVDLADLEGLHVVCSHNDVVLTVYRNKQLNLRDHRLRHFGRAA